MSTFFLICTAVGGTILVLQLALSVLGIGGDLAGDFGGDLGDVPDVPDSGDVPGQAHESGLSSLGKKLTFQTIVAFVTFFGVGGLSSLGFGWSGGASLATAVVVGLAAMALLAYAFGALRKLQGSGNLRLSDAVGAVGRVYLRVPAANGGVGKVTLAIQGRTEEVRGVTPGPELRSGEPIVVTRVLDARTIEVVAEAAYVAKAAPLSNYSADE